MSEHGSICSDVPLRSLLLSDEQDENERFANHIAQCAHCQSRLEQLAAAPTAWHYAQVTRSAPIRNRRSSRSSVESFQIHADY